MPNTSAIDTDDILASRWMGHNDIGDPDNDVDFEGHPVPQLVEVSGDEDEDSEFDLEDHEVAEDLLEVLETNVELDASEAGM